MHCGGRSPLTNCRSRASIRQSKQPHRIDVFYRTQRRADEGRAWFDQLTGAAVRHLEHQVLDPFLAVEAQSEAGDEEPAAAPDRAFEEPEQVARNDVRGSNAN